MYARRVGEQTLTFGVSGMLWRRSLVMYDTETGSQWSHILGEAMQGPLAGRKLVQIPSVMTDWGAWRAEYPNTSVLSLSRTDRSFDTRRYQRPNDFVLGITHNGKATAWTYGALIEQPARNVDLNGAPVLVAFERHSFTARLYSRQVGDRVLEFQISNGQLIDQQTGSVWNVTSGRATTGEMAGTFLKALPAMMSFRNSWRNFHPQSNMVRTKARAVPGGRRR